MAEWMPIESAPSDVEVLIYIPANDWYSRMGLSHKREDTGDEITTGIKVRGYREFSRAGSAYRRDDYFGDHFTPSHWMPLPAPPPVNEGSA